MGRILLYLLYIPAFLLSLLPLRVLYIFSDVGRFFIYHVFKYRRGTVKTNLKNAFPDKSDEERKEIERQFYRHFCDLFIEVFFSLFVSKRRVAKLVKYKNIELSNRYFDQGKSVIVVGGHYGNWELFNLFSLYSKHLVLGAYKPINNKHIENFINRSRERFGAVPVSMHDVARMSLKMSQEGKPFFLGLISDQTPAKGDIRYWTNFLNQDTPVFLGTEKIARKTNQPVFFCNMRKVSRGHYEVELELLCESPKETKQYEITEMQVKALERLIREAPQYWLWSHRRWKHKRKQTTNANSHEA
ncbi:MAG: lysophospholipid acyltransferase family protein [Bacteroidales bacterium]